MTLTIGKVYRYPPQGEAKRQLAAVGELPAEVDGLPNFLSITLGPDGTLSQLERGINPIRRVKGPDGDRVPAILVSSSPHKAGSVTTPWQDHFHPDVGFARYFGDAKPNQKKPADRITGNRALLAQFELHSSPRRSDRIQAAPIVLFQAVPHQGRRKGQRKFQGFGLVTAAERVVQKATADGTPFTNYRFDFSILDMSAEGETFSWDWINARRDESLTHEEVLHLAPSAWQRWVEGGPNLLHRVRRRVAALQTVKRFDQLPDPNSPTARVLDAIYHFYDTRKHRFEALAERVAARVMVDSGITYRLGSITVASSDGGADFVGRVDIGNGLAGTRLVVLGQAKCVKPTSSIGGEQLARVVARLRRGWIGVYVTTGHYSEPAQREMIEDRYPIMLINGSLLADTVRAMMHEMGTTDVSAFLKMVDEGYEERLKSALAEEILLEV